MAVRRGKGLEMANRLLEENKKEAPSTTQSRSAGRISSGSGFRRFARPMGSVWRGLAICCPNMALT